MKETVLLFGGVSDERLVSVATAQNLANRHDFKELWFEDDKGRFYLVSKMELLKHQRPFEIAFVPSTAPFAGEFKETFARLQSKVVFLGFHGTEGEDGSLQKLLEDAKIPFTGSGSKSSRLCFEKNEAKKALTGSGVHLAPELIIEKSLINSQRAEFQHFVKTHRKVVLKPVASGSSFGLHLVNDGDSLDVVLSEVGKSPYDRYIAEAFIQGRELTVGVLNRSGKTECLPASEAIVLDGPKFDYEGKYLGRGTKEVTPAEISAQEMKSAQELALKAHSVLGCYGYSRTDMILTGNGPYFLETNTLPGLTKASFIPQQLEAVGITMREFIDEQLQMAMKRYD